MSTRAIKAEEMTMRDAASGGRITALLFISIDNGPSADRPIQPRTADDADQFKFSVRNRDGLRELTYQGHGLWASRATTERAFDADPRPLAHLKPMTVDLDLNDVIALPGLSPDQRQWYIVPNSHTIAGTPEMACHLIPVDKPFEHHGLIGTRNFDSNYFRTNADTVVPVGSVLSDRARLYAESAYTRDGAFPVLPEEK